MQLQINTASRVPIYKQLAEQIRHAIARGDLQAEEQLPSVRQVSKDLVINPNTVARVYLELEREGILNTRPGLGVFVAAKRRELLKRTREDRVIELLDRFLTEAVHMGCTQAEVEALYAKRRDQFQWPD